MQICEKYQSDYRNSLDLFKAERIRFVAELKKIKKISVFPSQANFLMIELPDSFSSKELTSIMLSKYNILIKDLSSKTSDRQLIRVAIRNTEDNDYLLECLNKEFNV